MSKSIIQSFSYDITEAATVSMAEDKAKQEGKSFSKYILRLIKEDIDEQKKAEALNRLPILTSDVRQTTINEYVGQAIKMIRDTPEEELIEFVEEENSNIETLREVRQKLHTILFRRCGLTLTRNEQLGVVKY